MQSLTPRAFGHATCHAWASPEWKNQFAGLHSVLVCTTCCMLRFGTRFPCYSDIARCMITSDCMMTQGVWLVDDTIVLLWFILAYSALFRCLFLFLFLFSSSLITFPSPSLPPPPYFLPSLFLPFLFTLPLRCCSSSSSLHILLILFSTSLLPQ